VSHTVTQLRDMAKKAATLVGALAALSGDPRMTGPQFETALRKLLDGAPRAGNIECWACDQCERCTGCTFCTGSKGLARCHYCGACADCVDCSHCLRSTGCLGCQHCVESDRCAGSAYLVRSVDCTGCTYCFGCVGLSRRDFCILNEPYDRATYFDTTARLIRDLRIVMP
jgi:hypothetical protein